ADSDALRTWVAADYVPHAASFRSTRLDAGVDALIERLRQSRGLAHEVKRMIADGDLVFAHVKYEGESPVAGVDIFRLDTAGKIAEHWNVRQPLPQDSARLEERFVTTERAVAKPWPPERLKAR